MYIEVSTGRVFEGHADVRAGMNVMFGAVITDADLAAHGVFPLAGRCPEVISGMVAVEELPAEVDGVWTRIWSVREMTDDELKKAADELSAVKAELVDGVDLFFADIYARWFRFDAEHVAREAAARAFAASGYAGDAGVWVMAFASAAGVTAHEAADAIIEQAEALRLALEKFGELRMGKYAIQAAGDLEAAQAAKEAICRAAAEIERGLQ